MDYESARRVQDETHAEVLAARHAGGPIGVLLTVEHDPVITVTRRKDAPAHVLASPDLLALQGVTLIETDRGGDVTYHGPGQLVVYPILDLQRLGIRLHEHLRLMEQAVIDAIGSLGVTGHRDPDATGVWVGEDPDSKICAIGVRVRKWVTLHGLALNVDLNMDHFKLIVPCGLAGRPVTSLREQLDSEPPPLGSCAKLVTDNLIELLTNAASEKTRA